MPPIRTAQGTDAAASTTASGSPPVPSPGSDTDDQAGVNRAVALAGLATLLVLGAVLLLL